eukprot:1513547-Amphidinium_carterae.1
MCGPRLKCYNAQATTRPKQSPGVKEQLTREQSTTTTTTTTTTPGPKVPQNRKMKEYNNNKNVNK